MSSTSGTKSLNSYEIVLAAHPETTSSKLTELFKQIKEIIINFKGSLHHIDQLGSRPLANTGELKNVKVAVYFHFSYQALPSVVKEVERLFRITDFILYFHHEKLDSRMTLDQHHEYFEQILNDSRERDEQRQAFLKMKRKKHNPETQETVPS